MTNTEDIEGLINTILSSIALAKTMHHNSYDWCTEEFSTGVTYDDRIKNTVTKALKSQQKEIFNLREDLVLWALELGLSTGHADTTESLLEEVGEQVIEMRKIISGYKQVCAQGRNRETELLKEVDQLTMERDLARKECDKAEDYYLVHELRAERMRKALEFYADPETYYRCDLSAVAKQALQDTEEQSNVD